MSIISDLVYPRLATYVVGGTPTTGPFNIPFPFFDDDTVSVFVDGVEVTEYTIAKPSEFGTEGNTFSFLDPVQNVQVIVKSTTDLTRATGLTFVQAELSEELDRIFAIFQERDEGLVELSTQARVTLDSLEIPAPSASKLLGWNASATALINYSAITGTLVSATVDHAILRYDAGGEAVLDSNITIDDLDNMAGIGTLTAASLHVTGSVPKLILEDTDVANAVTEVETLNGNMVFRADINGVGAGSHIRWEVDGSEAMRLVTGGKLGIGTNNPAVSLHVRGWLSGE